MSSPSNISEQSASLGYYSKFDEKEKAYQTWREITDRLEEIGFVLEKKYALGMMKKME